MVIFMILPALVISANCFGADPFYDATGFDMNRETFSSMPSEHMDPFTGNLMLSHVDARLPGNAGLDLVIQRVYNSKSACTNWVSTGNPAVWQCLPVGLGRDGALGHAWRMHFGKVTGIVIEMPDGSTHQAYSKPGSKTIQITKDYWLFDNVKRILTFTNGTKMTFGQLDPVTDSYLATRIEDLHGNAIVIEYHKPDDNTIGYRVSRITDSVGRVINFTYAYTHQMNPAKLYVLKNIKGPGIDITYDYESFNLSTGATAITHNRLSKVTYPEGKESVYSYNDNYELESFTNPSGGKNKYEYDWADMPPFLGTL
jgi:hypothetical protein